MSRLKEILFGLKWKHKDNDVRARAVAEETDPRLLEALPDIAREDSSPTVRIAAIRRLDDMYHLIRLAKDETDPHAREVTSKIYRTMLAGEHANSPDLAGRLEIVPRLDDQELIEYLAQHGVEAELRRAAIAKIRKPGLLGDIAINDSNREVRLAAVESISQESTLNRVANAVRKKDKSLYSVIQKRLTGDAQAASANEEARAVVEQLENLSRSDSLRENRIKRLAELDSRWSAIDESARAGLAKRFAGARNIVQRIIDPPEQPAEENPEMRALSMEFDAAINDSHEIGADSDLRTVDAILGRLRNLVEPVEERLGEDATRRLHAGIDRGESWRDKLLETQPVNKSLLQLADVLKAHRAKGGPAVDERKVAGWQADLERTWSRLEYPTPNDMAVRDQIADELEKIDSWLAGKAERRDQALVDIDHAVDQLEAGIESGDLGPAAKAQGRVLNLLREIGRDAKVESIEFKARLQSARGKLNEMRDWQRWSNDKVRAELVAQAEALVGTGLHPDAVAAKVKEMRNQWRSLLDAERLPGDRGKKLADPELYERFNKASEALFEPAREYFDKRDQVRGQHEQELDELATEIERVIEDKSIKDVSLLERLVRAGRGNLRHVQEIPPRARGAMSRRLREGANVLDERLEEFYQVVERRKRRIIDELAELPENTPPAESVAKAKEAQSKWKDAGRGRRGREQKLWKEFRKVCDGIFDQLDAERSEQRQQNQAEHEEMRGILDQAEALLNDLDPEQTPIKLRNLENDWHSRGGDRKLDRIFADTVERINSGLAEQAREARREARNVLRDLTKAVNRLESRWSGVDVDVDTSNAEIDELLAMTDAASEELKARIERARGDAPADLAEQIAAAREPAEDLLVRLEFLAGVDTPEKFSQARMDYQVRRLSQRMAGEETQSLSDERNQLEREWFECGPHEPKNCASLQARFDTAVAALDESISDG